MDLKTVLDEIKQRHGFKANAEIARHLDIDVRRIGEYYKGREPLDDDYPKISMACRYRVDELQAMVKLTEGKDEKSRAVWARYYKSIGGIAASVALLLFLSVTLIVTSAPADAAPILTADPLTLCIMLTLYVLGIRIIAFVKHTPANAFPHSCFSG